MGSFSPCYWTTTSATYISAIISPLPHSWFLQGVSSSGTVRFGFGIGKDKFKLLGGHCPITHKLSLSRPLPSDSQFPYLWSRGLVLPSGRSSGTKHTSLVYKIQLILLISLDCCGEQTRRWLRMQFMSIHQYTLLTSRGSTQGLAFCRSSGNIINIFCFELKPEHSLSPLSYPLTRSKICIN